MQEREGRRRGVKRFARQVQHHTAVFAYGVQHGRLIRLSHRFAQDMNAFVLKALQLRGFGLQAGRVAQALGW